jgi:hypothetical protein
MPKTPLAYWTWHMKATNAAVAMTTPSATARMAVYALFGITGFVLWGWGIGLMEITPYRFVETTSPTCGSALLRSNTFRLPTALSVSTLSITMSQMNCSPRRT